MTASIVPFHQGPFPYMDIFMYASKFMLIADMANSAKVSKSWQAFMKDAPIWAMMYDGEKIPHVPGRQPGMEDFLFMAQRTCSAFQLTCLGGFVGNTVPPISTKAFEELKAGKDRYESSKNNSETDVVIVEPEFIYRPYDKKLLDALIKDGDFDPNAPENNDVETKGLFIPPSPKNVKIIAERFPVTKKSKGRVFREFDLDVLKQSEVPPKMVRVTIMRKELPAKTRKLNRNDQEKLLKDNGHKMVSFATQLYYDVITILRDDTCPHKKEGELKWNYSRTPDVVVKNGQPFSVMIGGYVNDNADDAKNGLHVYCNAGYPSEDHGAAVEIPDVVQKEAPVDDPMDIDETFPRKRQAAIKLAMKVTKTPGKALGPSH